MQTLRNNLNARGLSQKKWADIMFELLGKICNRNSNEWSLIWSVIIRVITESDDRALFMTSITDRSGRHDESRGINY